MIKVDLYRLRTAVETGEDRFYHGDVREGMLEALEELAEAREQLAEAREQLEEIKDVLGVTTPTA